MVDNPTDWLDYLLKTTPSSDYGILSSKLIDLNCSIPTEEVELNRSPPPKTQSSLKEYITDPVRCNHSQIVVASLVSNMQDLGSVQQNTELRRRRKRNNETPEEIARIDKEKKIKNRVSAARSRAKRNEYISMLEEKGEQLQRENELLRTQLKIQVETMANENQMQAEAETKAEKTKSTLNRLRRTISGPF